MLTTSKITFAASTDSGGQIENQDKFFAVKTATGGAYMGVCDGHGEFGSRAAEVAADVLLRAGPAAAIGRGDIGDSDDEDAFDHADNLIKPAILGAAESKYGKYRDYREERDGRLTREGMGGRREVLKGGTTATVVSVEDDSIRVAHVGDSEVIVVSEGGYFKMLTKDHSANSLEEYKRLKMEAAGSGGQWVVNVWFDNLPKNDWFEYRPVFVEDEEGNPMPNPEGGFYHSNMRKEWASYVVNDCDHKDRLAMTRSLGDFSMRRVGLSTKPDRMEDDICGKGRTWVIAASDGFFDSFTPEEIRDMVLAQAEKDGSAAAMQAHLMKTGLETSARLFGPRGVDNTTICVALVEPAPAVDVDLQLTEGTLHCIMRYPRATSLVLEKRARGFGLTLDLVNGKLFNRVPMTLRDAERLVRGG